jgi:secondary thiamine-phosphate synthase enzyme
MKFEVRTGQRETLVDVTAQVQRAVVEAGLSEGAVLVFVPHTTAGVTINENADPSVVRDILDGLRRIAPREDGWHHLEGNSDGHIKASLTGSSVLVPVENGRLALGTWQGIYFCEFYGPRTRHVTVTTLAEGTPL